MGSPSAATTRMSAASLSQGCMRGGAARRSSGCAAFNARRPKNATVRKMVVALVYRGDNGRCRDLGAFPLPTLGLLPPPLWGRGGEGGDAVTHQRCLAQSPPPPTPPHSRLRACPLPANLKSDQTPAGRGLVGEGVHR